MSGLALESDRRPTRANGVVTEAALIITGRPIDNLQARREHLTEQFFLRHVLKEKSSQHYLLPKRDLNTVNGLRRAKAFELSQTRTESIV